MVTLHTFALGKLDLFTVSLGKLNFSSVTDFPLVIYLGEILSSGPWICHENNRVSLDSYPKARVRANSNLPSEDDVVVQNKIGSIFEFIIFNFTSALVAF